MRDDATGSGDGGRAIGTVPAGDDRYRAPALDKGLDILELLSVEPGGLTRAEIVKAMGRSPGEIYRMLERLVGRDYVVRSLEGDRYALSMKMFSLAHRHPPLRRLTASAQPLMDRFAREAEQSCHLVALDREAALVVAQASCAGNWEFGLRVGASLDLFQTGSGQLLLACLGNADRARHLARRASSLEGGMDQALLGRLAAYRHQGFRVGDSQEVRGIQDLSAPVTGPDGSAFAVLTCPFVERLDRVHRSRDEVLGLVRAIAAELSLR